MKKTINIIIILFLVPSCGKKESITNFQDVYIYTSEEDKYIIKDVIEDYLFNFTFHTPTPQKRYNPVWQTELDFIRKPKNSQLMLISIENPKDTTIDAIANHLLLNSKDEDSMILIKDYFCRNQNLFILKYPSQGEMIADIYNRKKWILKELKNNDIKKIRDYSFRSGMNKDIMMTLDSLFSINMEIQKDYEIIKQDMEEKEVWIGRAYPYRWILFYEDNVDFYNTPEGTWNRFENKFNDILNVDIIPYETQFDKILVDNFEAKKIYGLFGTKIDSSNPTGGPFISYIFELEKTNKVLVVVGFVNFPGENKVFHIKELEYIIETININERKVNYE